MIENGWFCVSFMGCSSIATDLFIRIDTIGEVVLVIKLLVGSGNKK